jgi:hypothetical protein
MSFERYLIEDFRIKITALIPRGIFVAKIRCKRLSLLSSDGIVHWLDLVRAFGDDLIELRQVFF